jgi:hypothetical protein
MDVSQIRPLRQGPQELDQLLTQRPDQLGGIWTPRPEGLGRKHIMVLVRLSKVGMYIIAKFAI